MHLIMDIEWLSALKNGKRVQSNSNKNYDLSRTKAVPRKSFGEKYRYIK